MGFSKAERGPQGVWRNLLLALGLLILWQQVVFGGPIVRLDHAVQAWVRREPLPVAGSVAQLVTDVANPPFVIFMLLLIVAAVASRRHSWQPLVAGVTCVVLLVVAVLGLKYAIGRPGPAGDGSQIAWPSGHTTTAVVFWGVMARLLNLKRRWIAAAVAIIAPLLVGVALVLRNYHWTSDVLAGWLLGPLVLAAGYAATRWLLGRRPLDHPDAQITDDPLLARSSSEQ